MWLYAAIEVEGNSNMKKQLTALLLLVVMASVAQSGNKEKPASYDRANDRHPFTVFMQEGGWCWFQDPRAIIHDGKLFLGAIQGNGTGDALVGVYDLEAKKRLGNVVMHQGYDRDDHNSPVFFVRPDGSILAMYARHGGDFFHLYRISDPDNPLKWSEEKKKVYEHKNKKDKVTYTNLYAMPSEGKLYNFFRMIDYCPTFTTSQDNGETWSKATKLIAEDAEGRQRPYARYAGNGRDTIHISFTDAHPHDIGNSIYYAEFRDGNFYRADGTKIKNLAAEGPLQPGEAELIFKGSGIARNLKKPRKHSMPRAAWTSSIVLDEKGHPHIGYTLFLSNTDHRYRIASWDGKKWTDRELAFGGKRLYDAETSYTGLITLDPKDPEVVVISTDVDPSTGKDLGGQHEIYRAKVGSNDDIKTIRWQPITKNSPVKNIRPVILRKDGKRYILWNRGDYQTFRNYQLDTVGIIETVQ